jgi:hypothetical protein
LENSSYAHQEILERKNSGNRNIGFSYVVIGDSWLRRKKLNNQESKNGKNGLRTDGVRKDSMQNILLRVF